MNQRDDQHQIYLDYTKWVETHWSLARGNQIIVSPLEFDAILKWYEDGVPLQVVLRAMDRFLDRKKKGARKRNHLLNHIDQDVRKLFEEYRLLHAGSFDSDEEHDFDPAVNRIQALIKKLSSLGIEELQSIIHELDLLTTEEGRSRLVGFDEIEAQFESLNKQIEPILETLAGEATCTKIRLELSEFLDENKDVQLFRKAYYDQLRHQFKVPLLTILG